MNDLQRHSPLVLVHGLFGFDSLRVGGWEAVAYFRGIVEHLREKGYRVLAPQLGPIAGVPDRAAQLARFIRDAFPKDKVHLIAHSMGGLDCRYAISKLGLDAHVHSLTTIGTPHLGSAFADWGIHRLERYVKPVLQFLQIPHDAFYDLTTQRCRAFNDQAPDAPGVDYFAIAGRNHGAWLGPEWWLSYGIVWAAEGANDGVVSIRSACHHYDAQVWDGDHLSLVNWPNPRAIGQGVWRARYEQYASLAAKLTARGHGRDG
jgi:triacylglycerol lipase